MKGLLIKEWYSCCFFRWSQGYFQDQCFHAMRTVSGSSSRWHYHTVAVKLYRQNIS